ncbi:hypothetical protein CJD36_017680 [Flavipsychrobacter stenotrophus]|uniref:Uncharacterized protein n=1 Tax=Flavipsychrobacter stenotrophus TaxID=2077091 RepID=A0A2S7SSS8_9BACT|nr:hypothetical protein [Flavipsychrobacter stenotrophus]PQJ09758.1 hypothetical protein CJD36_017680 [Flavipsychrobacter stenotrophus]
MVHNTATKSHTVHLDILMDVLSILFDNEIAFTVEGIDDDEQTLLIRTHTDKKSSHHKDAMENIKILTSDYSFYRYSSDGQSAGLDIDIEGNDD